MNNTNPYQAIFDAQKANQNNIGNTNYKQRIKKLNKLKHAIEVTYKDRIKVALKKDLDKPDLESELTEIYTIISEIKHAKRHLRQWMRKQRVATPLSLFSASSYYSYEPKGVCLIISPWNYPFNLSLGPLVSAIAAGNTAIIKPSEMTPYSSALIAKLIEDLFESNEVSVVQGNADVATNVLQLPFNHIFFTGSPTVGKIVMKAASKHLASVTLELGGKSPVIVDSRVNINSAAKKIMWGKLLNCGQTCIAPDYALVDETIQDQFVEACKTWINSFLSNNPKTSNSYGKIVNEKHFNRLSQLLQDALEHDAKVEIGNTLDKDSKYIAPTILTNINAKTKVLDQEIFGPILPVLTYKTITEAIAYINAKERPLALYIFSNSKKNVSNIIANTRAGGTCINNNVFHFGNHNLPFGGINNSGIGKSHGFFGFEAFSNKRAVMKQHAFCLSEQLYPPYSKLKEKLMQLTIKWF